MGSSTYVGASHLAFKKRDRVYPLFTKTDRYNVINTKLGQEIGVIHWRGGWRQYVFQAKPEIDMSRSCMKEVIEFIDQKMKKCKENKQ